MDQADVLTPRLILEPLRLEHADLCFQPLQEPSLYAFVPQDPPKNPAELLTRCRRLVEGSGLADEVWLNWFGRLRDSTQYACTVQATVTLGAKSAYLAYQTFLPHRRTGIAKEACGAVLAHLAGAYGVRRIRAECDTRNLASRALLISLGFSVVAVKYAADYFKGASSDEVAYEKAIDWRWTAGSAAASKLSRRASRR